jgi:hypothetical protein
MCHTKYNMQNTCIAYQIIKNDYNVMNRETQSRAEVPKMCSMDPVGFTERNYLTVTSVAMMWKAWAQVRC